MDRIPEEAYKTSQPSAIERDLIIRMESLRMAQEIHPNGVEDAETIIKAAREFEAYIRGNSPAQ